MPRVFLNKTDSFLAITVCFLSHFNLAYLHLPPHSSVITLKANNSTITMQISNLSVIVTEKGRISLELLEHPISRKLSIFVLWQFSAKPHILCVFLFDLSQTSPSRNRFPWGQLSKMISNNFLIM
jgi:hypothetical protein